MFERDDIIHGDRFVEICDYAIEQNDSIIDDKKLDKNGLIFVKTDRIPEFFEIVRNKPFRYVIISHNSDHNITEELYATKPDNIVHWFGQNCLTRKPDLTAIPIGIERPVVSGQDTVGIILEAIEKPIGTRNLAYINMAWETNPNARKPILEQYSHSPWVTIGQRVPLRKYLEEIKEHVLVFCPPGNGWDTHRLWETLYLGRAAVVYNSHFDELFLDMIEGEERPFGIGELIRKIPDTRDTFYLRFKNWANLIRSTADDLL